MNSYIIMYSVEITLNDFLNPNAVFGFLSFNINNLILKSIIEQFHKKQFWGHERVN